MCSVTFWSFTHSIPIHSMALCTRLGAVLWRPMMHKRRSLPKRSHSRGGDRWVNRKYNQTVSTQEKRCESVGVEPQSWNRVYSKAGDRALRGAASGAWAASGEKGQAQHQQRMSFGQRLQTRQGHQRTSHTWPPGCSSLSLPNTCLPPNEAQLLESGRFVPSLPGDLKGGTISLRLRWKAKQFKYILVFGSRDNFCVGKWFSSCVLLLFTVHDLKH